MVSPSQGATPSFAYLYVLSRLDLSSVSAVLSHNLLLIWHILYPVDVFRPTTTHLAFDGERRQASENQDWRATTGSIVYSSSEALCSDIDVYDDALRFTGQSCVAIGHGESDHLVLSVLHRCPIPTRTHTSLGQVIILGKAPFFSFWPLTMASMMEG
jgi:hypothetical protein